MKPHVLIINRDQFGYHLDTYYYCKYGIEKANITYICLDSGRKKIELPKVNVIYIPKKGKLLRRFITFFLQSIKETYHSKYSAIFVKDFSGAFLLKCINPLKFMVLDIRTGSVIKNKFKRNVEDFGIWFNTLFFNRVSIISKSLAQKLKIIREYTLLPLGAEELQLPKREDRKILNLLYVGTFNGREIENTITGLAQFYTEFRDSLSIKYYLVGTGSEETLKVINNAITSNKLTNVIEMPGYIHKNDILPYFEKADLGITYVPINDIYDVQPSTKVFEYVLAGIPTIATKTIENLNVVNSDNGVLVNDDSESFYLGLKCFQEERAKFQDRVNIRSSLETYRWDKIVITNWYPVLNIEKD
jgi:hypothetical protein